MKDKGQEPYFPLIADLCLSLIAEPAAAQWACSSILRQIKSGKKSKYSFQKYERSWVLAVTLKSIGQVRQQEEHQREHLSPFLLNGEETKTDSSQNRAKQLEFFELHFHRLSLEIRFLLLASYRHFIPISELASALCLPKSSLLFRIDQSLNNLANWLWPKHNSNQHNRDRSRILTKLSQKQVGTHGKNQLEDLPALSFPFSFLLAHRKMSLKNRKHRRELPWIFWTLLESTALIAVFGSFVAFTPEMRNWIKEHQKTLSANTESLIELEDWDSAFQDLDQNLAPKTQENQKQAAAREPASAEKGLRPLGKLNPPQASDRPLWRFTLKTVNPDELRLKVIHILSDLGASPELQNMNGLRVPGGIEFDLNLSQEVVADLKQALELTQEKPGDFSWYKVKAKRFVPAGKSQVMIWLSQPNF